MSQPLGPQNFILISVIIHLALISLLLIQSRNRDGIPLQFETLVVFDKEKNPRESIKKTNNTKKVIGPKRNDTILPSPKNKGLLKANKRQSKNNLNPNASSVETPGPESGLKDFSRKWQRKNQLNSYKASLARIVSENWIVPPVNNDNFRILIETIIRSDGSIAQISFLSKTGMAVLDAAALKSIQVSVPFPSFQKFNLIEKKSIRVVFRFTPEKIDN